MRLEVSQIGPQMGPIRGADGPDIQRSTRSRGPEIPDLGEIADPERSIYREYGEMEEWKHGRF